MTPEERERAETQLRILRDYYRLYPNVDSFTFANFAGNIGLQMASSYEPDNDHKSHRMKFFCITSKKGETPTGYSFVWERPPV